MNTDSATVFVVDDDASVRDSLRRLIASGELPVHRLGRSVRISDADIAAFLAATRSI